MCLDGGPKRVDVDHMVTAANTVDVDHMVTAGINFKKFIQLVLPACFIFPQQQNSNVDDICLSSCSLGSKNHSSLSEVCQSSS